MEWMSRKRGSRGILSWCHSGLRYMRMVMCCGLVDVANWLSCIACSNCSGVVGCANPLPNHFVEKARHNDPKFLSFVKGEKKCLNCVK